MDLVRKLRHFISRLSRRSFYYDATTKSPQQGSPPPSSSPSTPTPLIPDSSLHPSHLQMTSVQTTPNGDPIARMTSRTTDAQTQTDAPVQPRQQPISDTLKAAQNRQSYRPPHQLNSPDATHAGSAALLAAQHTTSPTAWTYDGSAGASAAASLAKANSKPIEAWKPDKLSSAGAAASLAHRASISERTTPVHKNDGTASASGASAALRSPKQSIVLTYNLLTQ